MIGRFRFNGIESDSFDLVCKSVKRTLLPAVKLKRFEPGNVSGVYDTSDHEYSMRTLTMRITYIGNDYEELRTRAREIAAWLSTSTWAVLIIHDEPDKYYWAKVTNEIDLSSMWEAGEAEIQFDCQPFAYSVDEIVETFEDIVTGRNCIFTNPGTRTINYKSPPGSKFLITVSGSWTALTLSLQNVYINHPIAVTNGVLIIDNIELEATLNSFNIFSQLTGSVDTFLSIIAGENNLAIGGTNVTVDATVTYIPLWI